MAGEYSALWANATSSAVFCVWLTLLALGSCCCSVLFCCAVFSAMCGMVACQRLLDFVCLPVRMVLLLCVMVTLSLIKVAMH